ACCNIGLPCSLDACEGSDAQVVECSSFQLRFVEEFRPRVSVLLNVAPDHIDWHGSLHAYAAAKARVFERQGEGDTHVGNADDDTAARISRTARCRKAWFTLGEPGDGAVGSAGGQIVVRLGDEITSLGRPSGEG